MQEAQAQPSVGKLSLLRIKYPTAKVLGMGGCAIPPNTTTSMRQPGFWPINLALAKVSSCRN